MEGWFYSMAGTGVVNQTSKYTPLSIVEVRFLTVKEGGFKYVNWFV